MGDVGIPVKRIKDRSKDILKLEKEFLEESACLYTDTNGYVIKEY